MDLAALQQSLSALIRDGRASSLADDPYLRRVDGSRELRILRDVIHSWRALSMRGSSPLTARLLLRLGRLESALVEIGAGRHLPPFVEAQREVFLAALANDHDDLVRSVASFERALVRTRAGGPDELVAWQREPYAALKALLENTDWPSIDARVYWTRVSGSLHGGFELVEEGARDVGAS